MQLEDDQKYMRVALHMAKRGLGQTSPNPSVGAVLVQPLTNESRIISRAVTGRGGTPHGEPQAIDQAGEQAKGATLYVTLEPCSHQGRTPPCTQAIIKAGIKRVVVSSTDPDERVSGSGLEQLKAAGIEVVSGVCKAEGDELNAGHFLRQTEQRPFIIVKMAVSKNGLVAPAQENKPTWVTSPLARNRGHLLRASVDAILVGRTTVEHDDPTLTCRLNGMSTHADKPQNLTSAYDPRPIILDRTLALSQDFKLFKNKNLVPLVITSNEHTDKRISEYVKRGADIITCRLNENSQFDMPELTRKIAEKGITRLLVEGGPKTASSFIDAHLVDQLNIFQGAADLTEGGRLPFGNSTLDQTIETHQFILHHQQKIDDNMMYQYKKT